MRLKFYKEDNGDWFVDLPEWEGEKADLQMVAGADTMLDILAQGDDSIWLNLSTNGEWAGLLKASLSLDSVCADDPLNEWAPTSGAIYLCDSNYISALFPVWLCDVTKFVFGEFPKVIYIT